MSAKEKKKIKKNPEESTSTDIPVEGTSGTEMELRTTVDRLQRLQAEFENYKKRAQRESAVFADRIEDRVILDFLPLYDNLQRAFHAMSSNHDMDTFVAGIEQIFAQFQQVLEAKDVRPIDAIDQIFNPEWHEAMLSVPSDAAKNTVIEEFMPGYLRNERVLRPSKVSVSQGPQSKEDSE